MTYVRVYDITVTENPSRRRRFCAAVTWIDRDETGPGCLEPLDIGVRFHSRDFYRGVKAARYVRRQIGYRHKNEESVVHKETITDVR